MVYAIANLTSPLNSALQRGTNISKSEIITRWSVFPGTVTYIVFANGTKAIERLPSWLKRRYGPKKLKGAVRRPRVRGMWMTRYDFMG